MPEPLNGMQRTLLHAQANRNLQNQEKTFQTFTERPEAQEAMARGMYEEYAALIPDFVDLRHEPLGNLLHIIQQSGSLFIESSQGSFHVSMLTPRLPERRLTLLRQVKLIGIQVPQFEAFFKLNGPKDLGGLLEKVKVSSGQKRVPGSGTPGDGKISEHLHIV